MSAPEDAKPIGCEGCQDNDLPDFECQGCGYSGSGSELLGTDPDEDPTLWCPVCETSGWAWK